MDIKKLRIVKHYHIYLQKNKANQPMDVFPHITARVSNLWLFFLLGALKKVSKPLADVSIGLFQPPHYIKLLTRY